MSKRPLYAVSVSGTLLPHYAVPERHRAQALCRAWNFIRDGRVARVVAVTHREARIGGAK